MRSVLQISRGPTNSPLDSNLLLFLCLFIHVRQKKAKTQGKKRRRRRRSVRMATVGGVKEVEGNQNSLEIENLARFAIDEHNKKENALLEFVKVVNTKEQVVSGALYYITLEAVDGGQKKVYEAKVWVQPWKNFKELQEFKLVGNTPSDSSAST